ncbi:hypothetical protein BaRGS_00015392 [Batillaria attramentaria]|uniref:G-protein coupled receptors family 2 profile 2 domain-containing protein n=1 Tax=Batillaria attramentaria TaxID=370345 RepID=A0ABD0L1Z6_9CAEN
METRAVFLLFAIFALRTPQELALDGEPLVVPLEEAHGTQHEEGSNGHSEEPDNNYHDTVTATNPAVENRSRTQEDRLKWQPYIWDPKFRSAEEFLLDYCPNTCNEMEAEFGSQLCPTMECFPCDCRACQLGTCCPHLMKDLTAGDGLTAGCFYHVLGVTRCPLGWADSQIREACESEVGRYTEHEPVTDTRNQISYRNSACAACHGVSDYTVWELEVTCQHFQRLYHVASVDEFVMEAKTTNGCQTRRVLPDGVQYCQQHWEQHTWFSNVIETCNVTGGWKEYDVHLEENCLLFKALSLRVHDHDTERVFGNLFCALCNGVVPNRTVEEACEVSENPENDYDISDITDPDLSGYPPLSLLLGIRDHDRGVTDLGTGRCAMDNAWLALDNECRNLTCTPGKVIVNGTCSTAVSQIRGLMYSLNLTLVPTADVFLSAADVEVAKAHLSFEILQKLQTTASRFTITASLILKDSFGPLQPVQVKHLKVSGDLTTFRNITRDEVEITLVGNLFSDWEMTFSDRNASFRHSSVLHRSLETGLNSPGADKIDVPIALMDVDDFTSSTIPPDLHIPLSPLLLCPYLEFSPSEYEIRAKEGNNSVSEVALKFGDKKVALPDLQQAVMHNGTLQVCLETLEALPREKADDPLKWQYILSMVIIPLSIVCIVLTLIVYALLPVLRTQPGLNTMGTCCALLVAQVTLLLASHRVTSGTGCTALGMVVHMAWLSMFCWTSVCSSHMFRVFSSKTYRGSGSGQYWKVVRNIIITVLLPAAVVGLVVGVSYHTSGGASIGYSSAMCYLESALLVGVAMVLPVSVILLLNLLLFVLTVRGIHKVTKLQPRAESEGDSRQHLHVCARLSVLTGATWILSVIAEAWGITWLQAIAILTNGGQGILLFLSYVTTRRVTSMLAVKLGLREKDVSSARTHTTSDKYTSSIRTKSHHEQRIKSHIEQ